MAGIRRQARGERIGTAKLTENDVTAIRKLWASGEWSTREIAKRFRTSHQNISAIVNRKTWAHVAEPDITTDQPKAS